VASRCCGDFSAWRARERDCDALPLQPGDRTLEKQHCQVCPCRRWNTPTLVHLSRDRFSGTKRFSQLPCPRIRRRPVHPLVVRQSALSPHHRTRCRLVRAASIRGQSQCVAAPRSRRPRDANDPPGPHRCPRGPGLRRHRDRSSTGRDLGRCLEAGARRQETTSFPAQHQAG
jgi:hypothetical protein